MKFKNYINSLSRSNRIFSDEDILKMTLDNILDNEDTIMSQHSAIGIPSANDLQNSPNTEWINPFINTNGENDGGYWQSKLEQLNYPVSGGQISEKPIESFAQTNGNNPALLTNGTDDDISSNSMNETAPLLEGGVHKIDFKYLDKILPDKYKGLNIPEAVQKAASKIPLDTVEREYYGLSTKLKDREMVEDRTMEENDIYNLSDIKDPIKAKEYTEYLSKMYNLDPNDPKTYEKIKDKQIVVPKETSRLYNYAKNSEALQRWVAENYELIKNGEAPTKGYVEFPLGGIKGALNNEQRGLFATLHNMDIKNAKVNEDGSFELGGRDPYDFDYMEYQNPFKSKNMSEIAGKVLKNIIAPINNFAFGQQEAEQLEKYLLSLPIKLSKEEIEEVLKKYGKI